MVRPGNLRAARSSTPAIRSPASALRPVVPSQAAKLAQPGGLRARYDLGGRVGHPLGHARRRRSATSRTCIGGTFGGPINKNKTFFYFAYEGWQLFAAAKHLRRSVPSAAELAGDFSGTVSPELIGARECHQDRHHPQHDLTTRSPNRARTRPCRSLATPRAIPCPW